MKMVRMPGYQFHITEGPQSQEILVGVKKSISCFFTQKTTFKSGAFMLRPGALLTITKNGVNYPLLFLHLKSLTDPKGFGLRDDMTGRAIKFKKILDKTHKRSGLSGKSNFIFMGDLNTMGMNLRLVFIKMLLGTSGKGSNDGQMKKFIVNSHN
jgi:hypothetical protein